MTAALLPASDDPAKPPAWLATSDLPIVEVEAFFRVHRTANGPVFYSPLPGTTPEGRFDSINEFRTLYGASTFGGALVETAIRNPSIRLVDSKTLLVRSCARILCTRKLRLVKCIDDGLQAIGADNALSAGAYSHSRLWSKALYKHKDCADGLVYHSRHDPSHYCYAIWDRTDGVLKAEVSTELASMWPETLDVLRQYRKQLVVDP